MPGHGPFGKLSYSRWIQVFWDCSELLRVFSDRTRSCNIATIFQGAGSSVSIGDVFVPFCSSH